MAFKGFKKGEDQEPVNHFDVIADDSKTVDTVNSEEATDKNSPVYDVPKLWKKLIKNSSGASFSAYAKMAVREKLQRDGLI